MEPMKGLRPQYAHWCSEISNKHRASFYHGASTACVQASARIITNLTETGYTVTELKEKRMTPPDETATHYHIHLRLTVPPSQSTYTYQFPQAWQQESDADAWRRRLIIDYGVPSEQAATRQCESSDCRVRKDSDFDAMMRAKTSRVGEARPFA